MTAPFDLDLTLRLALFEHITGLREANGGVVPSRLLNEGLQFRGERVPLWNQQKGIFKPAILGRDGAALTIQTAYNGPYDDRHEPGADRLVYKYRGTDPGHPDNVALRWAMATGRPLLYLVGVDSGVYEAIFPAYVVRDRPDDLAVELLADAESRDIGRSLIEDPLGNAPLKAYATRAVMQRLHQRRFRYLVLHAYRDQCAMCRLRHAPLLDAAHILPDRDERGRPEIPNGLSLCRIHHGAYDVGILGVDPDYQVHLRQDVLQEHDGPMLRHGLQELHGERIQLPRNSRHRPNRDYLAERFARFRAA